MICKECGRENPAANLTCQNCCTKLYLAKLRVVFDSGRHDSHYLFPRNYKLGRGDESDIVVTDPSVSRFHAEIKFGNGVFTIIDNGSKNGSLINNLPFKNQELHDLDCIQIGNVLMHFYLENGKSGSGRLSTEKFVQEEFFKFNKNHWSEITTEDVLQTMLDLALSLVHAEKGYLFECRRTSTPELRFGINSKKKLLLDSPLSKSDRKIIAGAIELKRMKISLNGFCSESELPGWLRIAFPLVASKGGNLKNSGLYNDGLLGVCYFYSEEKSKPISERKKELLTVLMHQISIAMENERLVSESKEKRRISEQLLAARNTQQKLFPRMGPKSEFLHVATFVEPCETISGDYFDIVPITGSKIAVAIGDICGKGLPAALLASTVQAAISSQLEYSTSPHEIIHKLNRLLLRSTADSIFLTLFFGILDKESGIFHYINAGHPPPILIRGDDSIEELGATTFALGILEPETRLEKAIKFNPRDILILYTDGVIENQNGNKKIYGRKRLLRLIQSISESGNIRRRKLKTILRNIVDDLSEFSEDREKADDLTLLAIKRK